MAVSLERDGVAVVPGVLTPAEAADGLERLWAASRESERRGVAAHIVGLDPNASNVRVFNLIDLDPLFGELIAHPVADAVVSGVLGREYIVSNFTANIARPGSASMVVHSDQAAVMPEPWVVPQTVNVIWCLTDVHADNGATLHIPGSHRYRTAADVPADPIAHMVPFEAPAGSIIVMEGRVWHTSGRNVTDGRGPGTAVRLLHEAVHPAAVELHAVAGARGAGGVLADAALPPRARRDAEHAGRGHRSATSPAGAERRRRSRHQTASSGPGLDSKNAVATSPAPLAAGS